MDMQKSAASRVRHILQAMERSIDTARSRRVAVPGASAFGHVGLSREQTSESAASPSTSNGSAPINPRLAASAPPPAESRANTMIGGSALIGGNPAIARPAPAPVDPSQPARHKARPKRFESTFAAQMAQNVPTTYRSQAG